LNVLKERGIAWDPSYPVNPHEVFKAVGLEEWSMWERKYVTIE
jgi:hypothetical protein